MAEVYVVRVSGGRGRTGASPVAADRLDRTSGTHERVTRTNTMAPPRPWGVGKGLRVREVNMALLAFPPYGWGPRAGSDHATRPVEAAM